MKLNKDFKEFIELLNQHKVKYLLIGGWSVAIHGRPRYTKDIDFFILADQSNSKKMKGVIDDFGFATLGLSEADLATVGQIIQLGIEPNRIDLINKIPGVEFDEAWNNRQVITVDNVGINLISVDDLIKNKLASGRPQDLADVEMLKKINSKS